MNIFRKFGSVTVVALFVLTGCGDDGGGEAQGNVADLMIEALGQTGIEVDEGCVRDLANQLSDDDAAAIASAGIDGEPSISAEAEAIGERLSECVDVDG